MTSPTREELCAFVEEAITSRRNRELYLCSIDVPNGSKN